MLSAIQIAGFLNQPFLQKKSMKQPYYLHVDWKSFGLGMVKNWCDQSGLWTLKLTLSQDWNDGINWFFTCWYNFTQIKRWLKIFVLSIGKNGCGQSGDGTPKLTVSEEWIDGVNWFFACWYMIIKIKSWSKIFWVNMVKNGSGQSCHRILKLTVSKNEKMK